MSKIQLLSAPLRAVVTLLLLALAGFWAAPRALAQANPNPPERLTYQGFLADGTGTALGTNAPKNYDVVFRLWDDASATAPANRLWTEQQTVTVDKGFFSVLLGEGAQVTSPATEPHGALSTLFTNTTASDRFVEMTVKGIGAGGADVKILPRLRLLTSPYAYLATKAISANSANSASSVDGGAVSSGTVPDARLSSNVALRTGGNTFSGNQIFNNNATVNGQLTVVKESLGFQHSTVDGSIKLGSVLYQGSQEAYFGTFTPHPLYLIANNGSVAVAALLPNGNFGIGTTAPGVPLDVQNVGPVYSGSGAVSWWLAGGSIAAGAAPSAPNNKIGIRTSGDVQALAFVANSDQRIKTIQGRSEGVQDLGTLLGIEVTDYTYLDTLAKGTGQHKKVIAQQVEKVFPQAVSKSTDVVPDIYQKAEVKDGWVTLATNLKKGERVRLIGEKKQGVHEVLEVAEGRFRTDFMPEGDKVFVYGREVKDFRTVDYDAISMLNVSATQELARRLEKLEARESHFAELERKAERVETLEREVADLKKMVAQLGKAGKGTEQAAQATTPPRSTADAPVRKTFTTASLER